MANSIDNSNSRRSSINSGVTSNQQDTQSSVADGKWQNKNVKSVSTTPSVITDVADPETVTDATPAQKERHSSFITWLDDIKVQNKKSFTKEISLLSTKKIKKLQTLKKSDLSKEVDIPLAASIDSTPTMRKISLAAQGLLFLTSVLIAIVIATSISLYLLIPLLVIFVASISFLLLVDIPKKYNDHTKIINLDQKSVRVGMTDMLHTVFNEMDIDKNHTMEYEAIKNKIEQIIEDGTAFQQFNRLNNNIKTVSNYDDAQLLNELTKDREQLKIQKQVKIIFSSLFLEIETTIQDEEFRNSFSRAKQKYFTSLAEKGFENKEHLEFSYLFLHNLCDTRRLDYRRDDINPIIKAGITDGIKSYARTITRRNKDSM